MQLIFMYDVINKQIYRNVWNEKHVNYNKYMLKSDKHNIIPLKVLTFKDHLMCAFNYHLYIY